MEALRSLSSQEISAQN